MKFSNHWREKKLDKPGVSSIPFSSFDSIENIRFFSKSFYVFRKSLMTFFTVNIFFDWYYTRDREISKMVAFRTELQLLYYPTYCNNLRCQSGTYYDSGKYVFSNIHWEVKRRNGFTAFYSYTEAKTTDDTSTNDIKLHSTITKWLTFPAQWFACNLNRIRRRYRQNPCNRGVEWRSRDWIGFGKSRIWLKQEVYRLMYGTCDSCARKFHSFNRRFEA